MWKRSAPVGPAPGPARLSHRSAIAHPTPWHGPESLVERGIALHASPALPSGSLTLRSMTCRRPPSSRRGRGPPRRRTTAPAGCSPRLVEIAVHVDLRCPGTPGCAPPRQRRGCSTAGSCTSARWPPGRTSWGDRIEVPAFELPVAGDSSVRDPSVQCRHHLDAARPVLRRDRPLDAGLHACHAHEAPAPESRLAAGSIPEVESACHGRVADVELVAVGDKLDVAETDRFLALDPQLLAGHCRRADQVLVQTGRPPMIVVSL